MKLIIFMMIVSSALVAQEPASWFITDEGKPTEALQTLLELDGLYDAQDTLAQTIGKTQKAWIQVNQGKKERTDLVDTDAQKEKRQKIETVLEEMGFFKAREPSQKHYEYAGVYGAFIDATRSSFQYIFDCWDRGIHFDSIVVFSGNRALRKNPGQEDDPAKLRIPLEDDEPFETEYDMCRVIWKEFKREDVPIYFVDARGPEGSMRPSRKDCYQEWLKTNPKQGSILASSHPLYWHYQQLAGLAMLPTGFTLDTCCNEASRQMRLHYDTRLVSLIQDTIAKCLYEIGNSRKPLDE